MPIKALAAETPKKFPLCVSLSLLPASLAMLHQSLSCCCKGHERASFALHAQRVACAICRVHITHTQRGRHKARSGLAGTVCGMQIAHPTLGLAVFYVCVCVCVFVCVRVRVFYIFYFGSAIAWLISCPTSVASVSRGTCKAHDKSGIFCMGHSYSARHSGERGSRGREREGPQNY